MLCLLRDLQRMLLAALNILKKFQVRRPSRRARKKVNYQVFEKLCLEQAHEIKKDNANKYLFNNKQVIAVDGAKFHVQKSKELLEHFSPRHFKDGISHYPQASLLYCLDVFNNTLEGWDIDNWNIHENNQFRRLINQLPQNSILLLDRGFAHRNSSNHPVDLGGLFPL